jgi:uncharacterized membrane protein
VFAIAITLLILDVAVPDVGPGESLAHALRHEWPSYFGYVVSFLTIGIVWWNHHELFEDIRAADHVLMVLNLLLLLCIAFAPFPTALLAQYVRERRHEVVAVAAYGGTYTAMAVVFNALWLYAAYRARLLADGATPARVHSRTLRYAFGPVLYGASIPLAFLSPWLSLTLFGALALLYLLPPPE